MARLSLLALALITATSLRAAPPPQAGPADIIVNGHGPDRDKRDKAAVGRISRPVSLGGFDAQYGRWNSAICVGVAGLPAAEGQLIADRISQIADSLKITVGEPGCAPNVYIVLTSDPQAFIRKAQGRSNTLLSNIDLDQIEAMKRSHAAVRWAGMIDQTGRMGDPIIHNGQNGATHGGVVKTLGSLIKAPVTTHLVRMVVLVDASQIDGMKYSTLSAYLAMVSLAQLRPNPDAPMVNTVLSAFRDKAGAPDDLTDFDRAYLTGLYAMRMDDYGIAQKQQIASRVKKELDKPKDR